MLRRYRIGHDGTAADAQRASHVEYGRDLLGRVEAPVDGKAARPCVEGGELVGPVADDRYSLGLEYFQSQTDIEHGLGARAHDGDLGPTQFEQVRRDVHGVFGSAMRPTDAARGEYANPRECGRHHRAGDRCGAIGSAGQKYRDVSARCLGDVLRCPEVLDLGLR